MSDENAILRSIERLAKKPRGSRIRLGIGDDAAIYSPAPGEDLVFTTDLLVEGVHFRFATHSAADAGHKALARGLSDIAAMGAAPRFCLLSLAVLPGLSQRWISGFFKGLTALAAAHGTELAGGDLGTAPVLMADIVVAGSVPEGSALRRDAARPGDRIFVSGELGGSALGLAEGTGRAGKRHRRPEPRVALGIFLRKQGVSACMDLSDGLSSDLARLCAASGVAARIEEPPLFPGASLEQALHGGEDYELLFTAPPQSRIPERFGDIPLHAIGTIREGPPGRVWLGRRRLPVLGYDHFRSRT